VTWLLSNAPYVRSRCALAFCLDANGTACASVEEYARLVAQDGFWLGTLFFHWGATLVCGHSQDIPTSLPLYNYVLRRAQVARGVSVTVGEMRQVHPFIQAPHHILEHGVQSTQFIIWLKIQTTADFCPSLLVPGDFECPPYALVVCNSQPNIHWQECLYTISPSTHRPVCSTRSTVPSVHVREVYSVQLSAPDVEIWSRTQLHMVGHLSSEVNGHT
jgi:hypothetical protein